LVAAIDGSVGVDVTLRSTGFFKKKLLLAEWIESAGSQGFRPLNNHEGSIPFTRSIENQGLAQLCRKSAGKRRSPQVLFLRSDYRLRESSIPISIPGI
jgi:hypothetical protein